MADQAAPLPSLRVLPAPADDGATAQPANDAAAAGAALVPEVVDDSPEGAYTLWAYECDQNAAEVGRRLCLPVRTVQHWAKADGWRDRLARERRELMVRNWRAVEATLAGAAPKLVAQQIRIGLGEGGTKRVVLKDGTVAEVDNPVPYVAQVHAQNSLLDRFGFIPATGQRQPPVDPPGEDDALSPEKVAAMSDDERRAILHRMTHAGEKR